MVCCLTAPTHYLTNVDLSSMRSFGIHRRALSWEDLKIPISKTRLKITFLGSHSDLPGANKLNKTFWPLSCWIYLNHFPTPRWHKFKSLSCKTRVYFLNILGLDVTSSRYISNHCVDSPVVLRFDPKQDLSFRWHTAWRRFGTQISSDRLI